jgi:hypothetical protein
MERRPGWRWRATGAAALLGLTAGACGDVDPANDTSYNPEVDDEMHHGNPDGRNMDYHDAISNGGRRGVDPTDDMTPQS